MTRISSALLAFGAATLALAVPAFAQTKPSAPAAATPATTAAASLSTEEAIAFAKKLTGDATASLTAKGASESDKLKSFQGVLGRAMALDVIGKFMVGETRKKMTPAQVARYDAAFPPYLTKLYAEQFKDIVGRPLEVVDAKAIGAKDAIVRTRFNRKEGAPINVDWRIRKLKSGELKAIDIIANGVSITLVKREEFSAFVKQSGVEALIQRIEKEGKI